MLKKLVLYWTVFVLFLTFAPGIPPNIEPQVCEVKKIPLEGPLAKNTRLDRVKFLPNDIHGAPEMPFEVSFIFYVIASIICNLSLI